MQLSFLTWTLGTWECMDIGQMSQLKNFAHGGVCHLSLSVVCFIFGAMVTVNWEITLILETLVLGILMQIQSTKY